MALFKILHGDSSKISLDTTPFHEGWMYLTHDGYFHVDINIGTAENPNNQRIKLNANQAESLVGYDISTILNSSDVEIPTSKAVLDAIEAVKIDSSNKAAVVLAEAQAVASNTSVAVLAEAQRGIDSERERAKRIEGELSSRIDALDSGSSSHSHSWNDLEEKPFGEEADGTINTLDEKYIPDSIARVSYVQDIIANIPQTGQPKIATITIPAANWIGDTNPWSQTVTFNGATTNSKLDLCPTATEIVSLQNNEIMLMLENNDGEVTAWAIGNKPTEDYTMQVLITEVVPV